ncbi:MAG: FAD-binding oxidoreductase [Rhodobacteraceae bacterium]|nr:FAD-binding oxidoreductase [Paracoccaceae bacterium]
MFVLRRLGWFIRFLAYCRPAHSRHAALALRGLLQLSLDQHKKWIKAAGVDHLLRHGGGWFKLFRSPKAFKNYAAEMDMMRAVGVKFSVIEREQIRQIEPGLAPIYHKGVLMDETCAVSSPADLTDAYLAMFQAAGGVVECAVINGLAHDDDGWQVRSAEQVFCGDDVVLAAGAWSAEIAGWLGYDIPMAWERGYHLHFAPAPTPNGTPAPTPPLGRPILDVEGGFVVAPMRQHLRVTSGVELTDRDAPPNFQQITTSVALAGEAVTLGAQIEDTPWMGRRPTLVDSLPMIGAAPRHHGLWFNFGHHHIGLSMAPGSALLLSALINDTLPPLDPAPFRASRFAM